jgi:Ca-activated chloride channel family protein
MAGQTFTRLALAAALGTLAVGNPARAGAQQSTFKSGVEMVPLTVTVTDAKGKHVAGLTGGDFTVLEDGVAQPLSFFATAEVPVDVALVIDASSSMSGDLPLVQKAACGLVRTLRASDRGAVVEVKDAVRIPQPLTSDHGQIETTIRALRPSGNTALYDGLYVMLKEFDRGRRANREVRRQALVLLSDGLDNTSHLLFEDVMELARRVGVNIYVIALRGESARLPRAEQDDGVLHAEYAMKTVARETGGRAFFPRTSSELPAIYDTIALEIASQYELGYVPARPDTNGAFRRVAVRMAPATAALARTRSGYYASVTPGVRFDPAARTSRDPQ